MKRARSATIHAHIIGHLRDQMPSLLGKSKVQKKLLDNLGDEFVKVQKASHFPGGDFPEVEHYKDLLSGYNFDRLERLKPRMIQNVDDMLSHDIPNLLTYFRNPYD